MATLAEIREQYPAYAGLSDEELADGLYRRFYSDMDRAEFDGILGLVPANEPVRLPGQSPEQQATFAASQLQVDQRQSLRDSLFPPPSADADPSPRPEPTGLGPPPASPELQARIDTVSGRAGQRDVGRTDLIGEPPIDLSKPPELGLQERDVGIFEWFTGLFGPNKDAATVEAAARDIAETESISVDEVYRRAGGARSMFNPEGRPPIRALVEGAGIVAKQLPEVPSAAVNTVLRAIRGGNETDRDTFLNRAISATAIDNSDNFQDPNYEGLQGIGYSLGFSLVNMTAAALAAAGAGAVTGGNPIAAVTAGLGASGTVAFRASKDQFLDLVRDKLDADSKRLYGRKLTGEEWAEAVVEYDAAATKYGAFEAIPEAVSSVIFVKLLSAPLRGVSTLAKLQDVVLRATTMQVSEQTTELITTLGQQDAERDAGLSDERLTPAQILRQQALNVGIVTLGLGAGGTAGRAAVGAAKGATRRGKLDNFARALAAEVDASDFVAEQLSFSLVESEIDLDYVQIGNIVSIRLSDMALGAGLERNARILGLQPKPDLGTIDVELQVLRRDR